MAYSETKYVSETYTGKGWFVGGIVTLALLAIGYLVFSANDLRPTTPARLSSTVTISLEKGHGSGVHIGNGLILSAAHVASEGDTVSVKTSDGQKREAVVVWASLASDIALLQTSSDQMAASTLSCAPVQVGQSVRAEGSPLDVGQVTTYGHIIGLPRAVQSWASVVPVDMTVLPGMSGGPLLNDAGEVVGITVGVATASMGFTVSLTGIGLVVPSSVVCNLLGRI